MALTQLPAPLQAGGPPSYQGAPGAMSLMNGRPPLSLHQGPMRGVGVPFPLAFGSSPQSLAQQNAMAQEQHDTIRQRLQQVCPAIAA